MARIILDEQGNIHFPTIVLVDRSLTPLLAITNIDYTSYEYKHNSDGSEVSFDVYKPVNHNNDSWNAIEDLALIWIKDTNEYFEISVTTTEEDTLSKTITGTYLPIAELSQIYLFNVEINTTNDINRDDYITPTIFFDENNPSSSLLHRILSKAPHYVIGEIDASLRKIQRTFQFNGTSIKDALNSIEKQIGCKFIINSATRTVNAIDLYATCLDCDYRGDFIDTCPKCASTNILPSYGEDSGVFISNNNLSESVSLTSQDASLKSVFYLSAGDEDMNAAIINLNPSGTRYLYSFGKKLRSFFSPELKKAIASYEEDYNQTLTKDYSFPSNDYNDLARKYNAEKYATLQYDDANNQVLTNNSFTATTELRNYSYLIAHYYSALDFYQYLNSSLMPTVTMDIKSVDYQIESIIKYAHELGIADFNEQTTSIETIKSSAKLLFMAIINGAFKVTIDLAERNTAFSTPSYDISFTITSYQDKTKTKSDTVTLAVKSDYDLFISQRIAEKISQTTDESGIYSIITYDTNTSDDTFKQALTYYSLTRLTSFHDAIQSGLEVLAEDNYNNVFDNIKNFYTQRLQLVVKEMEIRQKEVTTITSQIEILEKSIQDTRNKLSLSNYLNDEALINEWMSFRREQEYSNANFVSTNLDTSELLNRAKEFLTLAKNELNRASQEVYTLNATIHNLMLIPEFKPFWSKFDIHNWIVYRVDDKLFRLRLMSYRIRFDENAISTIEVEFSSSQEGLSSSNPYSSAKEILNQAKSISSSYNYIQHQTLANTLRVKYLLTQNSSLDQQANDVKNLINDTNAKYILISQRENARYREITTDVANIKDAYVSKAEIDTLLAKSAMFQSLSTDIATIIYADIDTVLAKKGFIKHAEIQKLIADNIKADELDAKVINSEKINAHYANVDMLNVESEAVKNLLVRNGIIASDAVIENGRIVGVLDAVTVNADTIKTGTLAAKRIAIIGKDGLYHQLNTQGGTSYDGDDLNSYLDGSHIVSRSITANKISIDDLHAFGATIGGFVIEGNAIRTFEKHGLDEAEGIYFGAPVMTWQELSQYSWDEADQFAWANQGKDIPNSLNSTKLSCFMIGSTTGNHILYNGHNLEIVASDIRFAINGKTIQQTFNDYVPTAEIIATINREANRSETKITSDSIELNGNLIINAINEKTQDGTVVINADKIHLNGNVIIDTLNSDETKKKLSDANISFSGYTLIKAINENTTAYKIKLSNIDLSGSTLIGLINNDISTKIKVSKLDLKLDGDTLMDKLNASSTTTKLSSSRIDLSGSTLIAHINSDTTSKISTSKLDLVLDGNTLISKINDSSTTSKFSSSRIDLSGSTLISLINSDTTDKIKVSKLDLKLDGNTLINTLNSTSTTSKLSESRISLSGSNLISLINNDTFSKIKVSKLELVLDGNTLISKINDSSTTSKLSSSRIDLSGSTLISLINSDNTSKINVSKIDLILDGNTLISTLNSTSTTSKLSSSKIDLTGSMLISLINSDNTAKINISKLDLNLNGNSLMSTLNGSSTTSKLNESKIVITPANIINLLNNDKGTIKINANKLNITGNTLMSWLNSSATTTKLALSKIALTGIDIINAINSDTSSTKISSNKLNVSSSGSSNSTSGKIGNMIIGTNSLKSADGTIIINSEEAIPPEFPDEPQEYNSYIAVEDIEGKRRMIFNTEGIKVTSTDTSSDPNALYKTKGFSINTYGLFYSTCSSSMAYSHFNDEKGYGISFGISYNGNDRGIYDEKSRQWIIYKDVNNTTLIPNYSDRRTKNYIHDLDFKETASLLDSIQPIVFTYKDDPDRIRHIGIYAQDYKQWLKAHNIKHHTPLLQQSRDDPRECINDLAIADSEVKYQLDYTKFIPYLWNGWRYHEQEILRLRQEIKELKELTNNETHRHR